MSTSWGKLLLCVCAMGRKKMTGSTNFKKGPEGRRLELKFFDHNRFANNNFYGATFEKK